MSVNSRVLETRGNVITQNYKSGIHSGIDIVGTGYTIDNIIAHSDGVVVSIRNDYRSQDATGNSYGNYVKIKHDNGMYTLYSHLAFNSVKVEVNQRVNKGDVIGLMGATGHATGIHLHFEVLNLNNDKIDPTNYINDDLPDLNTNVLDGLGENELLKLANDVILGKYGNGDKRVKALGDLYDIVQNKVNEIVLNNRKQADNSAKNTENKIHTVKKGENLSIIANKYNSTWQKIYNDNRELIDTTAQKHGVNSKYGYYNFIYEDEKLVIKS